jgi:ketosteroid isomerase-like protein
MRLYTAITCLVASVTLQTGAGRAYAQTPQADVVRDINAQIWITMLRASDAFDAEGFLAVLSRDLVRVSMDRNEIYGFDRYSTEIRAGFERARQRKLRRRSTVRFLARSHSGDLARDTGIFRSEVILPGGETRISYTAFEMILRKENGRWKLLVDQDAWRGGMITEADYLKGAPMTTDIAPATKSPTARPN